MNDRYENGFFGARCDSAGLEAGSLSLKPEAVNRATDTEA
jgi:hypothetical protein